MVEAASAASLLIRLPQAVLSHEEAARRLGIELLDDDGVRRLTVPRTCGRLSVRGWRISRADLPADAVLEGADGVRMTSPKRTVFDLARVLSVPAAVAAADSALRRELVTATDLVAALQTARGTGSAQQREVASLLDPLSGSVLESVLRVTILRSGLTPPATQYWVADGRELFARVDFCWPAQRLIVEADGFAFHSDREAYRRDRERLNRLERLGWRVLRFTWEDVMSRPEYVLASVRACLARAVA